MSNAPKNTTTKNRATPEERIAQLKEKEAELKAQYKQKEMQLKAQRTAIEQREKAKARKARTRHLIQAGALALKYHQAENMTLEEFEQILKNCVSPTVASVASVQTCPKCNGAISDAEISYSERNFGESLCRTCQPKR